MSKKGDAEGPQTGLELVSAARHNNDAEDCFADDLAMPVSELDVLQCHITYRSDVVSHITAADAEQTPVKGAFSCASPSVSVVSLPPPRSPPDYPSSSASFRVKPNDILPYPRFPRRSRSLQ